MPIKERLENIISSILKIGSGVVIASFLNAGTNKIENLISIHTIYDINGAHPAFVQENFLEQYKIYKVINDKEICIGTTPIIDLTKIEKDQAYIIEKDNLKIKFKISESKNENGITNYLRTEDTINLYKGQFSDENYFLLTSDQGGTFYVDVYIQNNPHDFLDRTFSQMLSFSVIGYKAGDEIEVELPDNYNTINVRR